MNEPLSSTVTPRSPAPTSREAGAWSYAPDVAVTGPSELEGRYALVDLSAPAVPPRVLTGPAALIWGSVDGERDTDAVVRAVADLVELDPDEVRADVETFLEALLADGLLVRSQA